MIKLSKRRAIALAGGALLLALHFYRLGSIPGLHYDEAWAMNYSWRIAHEKGFWPLTAMSPYTAPWAHYWAALWLKLLGPSVLVFRGSQVALALAGLGFLVLAQAEAVQPALVLALLLVPGLLLNQRFAIELTGFHVFAYGLLLWLTKQRRAYAASFVLLAGTTAHILFYGVALASLGTRILEGRDERDERIAPKVIYFSLMSLFFLRVFLHVPEKGKAGALLLSSLMAIPLLLTPTDQWRVRQWKGWRVLLAAAALLFALNCVFFAEGVWGLATASGQAEWKSGIWLVGILGLFGWMGWGTLAGFKTVSSRAQTYFLLLVTFFGLMMLKPAPRYFEIPMLTFAVLLAHDWATRWRQQRWHYANSLFLFALATGSVAVFARYFSAVPLDQDLRFAAFKDSSRDFLDKQSLVQFLGGGGCAPDDIHTDDPRLREELNALALGDWPVNHLSLCRWNFVARRSDGNAVGEKWGEFVLRRKP